MLNLIIALSGSAADLYIKDQVEKGRIVPKTKLFGGLITTEKVYNPGAFLGFLEKTPTLLKWSNIGMLAVLLVYNGVLCLSARRTFEKIAVGLITAGAFSNLFDRFFKGKVTDYFMIRGIKKVVFNLGDLLIFIGAFLYVLKEIRDTFK